jgi:ribosomal protein S18 acetylase RimI-like enzyme
MKIQIIPGKITHLADCQDALLNSAIGEHYFTEPGRAERFLSEGFEKNEIYVAVNEVGECLGYIWFTLRGAFYSFPYVRNLMVKAEYRSQGVGQALLDYFHEKGFAKASSLFLTVSDFNHRARQFYEANGYVQVGLLPDLLRPGVSERVMMKKR